MQKTTVKIFFYLFLWAFFQTVLTAGDVTASGVLIEYDRNASISTSPSRFIHDVDREISRFFKAPRVKGNCRVLITPTCNSREVRIIYQNTRTDILIGDDFIESVDDMEFQRSFFSTLLLARFGVKSAKYQLPDWIVAGIEDSLNVRLDSASVVRGGERYYPTIRAFVLSDEMPVFTAIMKVPGLHWEGAARESYGELSRFILEVFAAGSEQADNALGDYAVGFMTGTVGEDELLEATLVRRFKKLNPLFTLEEMLQIGAKRSVFSVYHPLPAAESLEMLSKALEFNVPVIDESGKPSGKYEAIGLERLAEYCVNNPADAGNVKRKILEDLDVLGGGLGSDGRNMLQEMVIALSSLYAGSSRAEIHRLLSCRDRLTAIIKKQAEIEKHLEVLENREITGFWEYRYEIYEFRREDELLSGAGIEYLEGVEARYLE